MTQEIEPATLAVVILTLNEEVNVARCVRSALTTADEVVVVDSGSSDDTAQIASAFGVRVLEHRQNGAFDIAAQRNWALQFCQLNAAWVLFLDADEEVTPELRIVLQGILAEDGDSCDAFELTPKYLFYGRWMKNCMGYPNWHPRLVHRVRGPRFSGGVWEHFESGFKVGRIAEPYLHHGNSKGFRDWLERHDRYSTHDASSIVDFLASGDPSSFRTQRKLVQRRIAARAWRFRPLLRFVYMYLLRGGVRDGAPAFWFCLRYAMYEFMTVQKVQEALRLHSGDPL